MKSFSELENEIRRLNQTLQNLGKGGLKNKDLENALKSFNGDAKAATDFFKMLNQQAEELHYTFSGIGETLKNALQDLKGQVEATNQINKSYSKLSSVASQLSSHQKNDYVLSVKKLKNIQKEVELEIQKLENARKELSFKKKTVGLNKKEQEYYSEINKALNLKNSYLKQTVKELDKEVKLEEKRANALGLTQGMFKGIHGLMKKIGVESEAFDNINKAMREAAGSGNVFKTLMAGVKTTASEMKDSFFDVSTSVAIIAKTFSFLKNVAFGFGDSAFQIQQNLGTSWQEAQRLNEELFAASTNTAGLYSTHDDLVKAQIGLNSAMGTFNAYGISALDNFTKLQEVAGMTADEAAKLQEYGDLYGKTSEEIYDTIGQTKKGLFNNKQIMSQVLKINGQLAAQYKNSPELLAKAVVQANKLGITLEQAKNASSSLLDFESSIQNELEAELLTGKNLNFEQARYLALMGDSAGAAEEMLKQVGGIDSFNKMNVIQQESIAKSMGMSTDELANSLVKQKQLEKLDKNIKKDLEERVKQLRDAGKMEEAAALEKAVLNGENVKSVKLAEQELDAKRKAEKAIARAKEQFMKAIAPLAMKVANLLTDVMDYVSKSPIIKAVIKAVGDGLAIGAVVASLVSVGNIIGKVFGGGGLKSLFGKQGSTPANPLYVSDVGGGGGSMLDMIPGSSKFGGAGMKFMKSISQVFGGKNSVLGRAFRSGAAWMGKPGSFFQKMYHGTRGTLGSQGSSGIKHIFKPSSPKGVPLTKLYPSGVPGSGAVPGVEAAAESTSIMSKLGSGFSKFASGAGKALKFLGPAGAILDLGMGTFTGAQAGSMSKEEQKAAGIRQGMGSAEGGIAGFLTGGAEKGSVMSEYLGIEKGSGGDESMGVLGAAGRGALIGSVAGPIGALVGAGVGGIAESVKLLVNPDSQLRKTLAGWGDSISEFASSSYDTLSGWASEASSSISDFASSSWDTLKGWGSSLMDMGSGLLSSIGDMASGAWKGIKSIGGGIVDSISGGISSAGDFISSGVSAVGDWLGFAEGGIVSTPTKAKIGEGGGSEAVVPLDQFYAKLDQLINAVNSISSGGGGDVILDGQKVGKVINMSARGIQ